MSKGVFERSPATWLLAISARRLQFRCRPIERVGRYLLRNGHTKDAIRIFQLNAAVYPSLANTFDALGDAYEKDGNRALAISNYEKAQQLDPKLAHAADALKRLKN